MQNRNNYHKTFIIAGILIFLAGITELHAQESPVVGGLKGGLNLSSMTIDGADDNNILTGFHAGVWAKAMVGDKFGIQPEILYSGKGVKTVYDQEFLGFDVADGETKLNLSYLDIPVFLVFQLAEDFNFHLGPRVGFLLDASMDTQAEILEFINVDDQDDVERDNFNTVDFGLVGGLGFNFDPVTVGFNYDMGLTQVAKDGEFTENLFGDARNTTIQVYVGFAF